MEISKRYYDAVREQRERAFNAWKESRYTDKGAFTQYAEHRNMCERISRELSAQGVNVNTIVPAPETKRKGTQ